MRSNHSTVTHRTAPLVCSEAGGMGFGGVSRVARRPLPKKASPSGGATLTTVIKVLGVFLILRSVTGFGSEKRGD